MNQEQIKKILPQRYPFLFIDKILEFEKDKKLVALKNVTANEEYFSGHFPKMPVMPGVLLIETMGQAGILFLNLNSSSSQGTEGVSPRHCEEELQSNSDEAISHIDKTDIYYLCSVKARFLKPVVPGDQVLVEVTPVKLTKDSGIVKTVAKVDGKEVARAELTGARQK